MPNIERQVVDLGGIRADGWFEQLETELDEFEQLCEVIGTKFLAFSFVLGVQIVAVSVDGQSSDASVVEFVVGEGETQSLSVSDFRERIGAALLSLAPSDAELSEAPTSDEIRDCIGRRYLLLAPVFGLRLVALHLGADRPPTVLVDLSGSEEELSLSNLHSVLDNAIRSELSRARPPSPFSIDFKKVPEAEDANRRRDYDTTIGLLGAWPGPLSMFVRTPQAQALGTPERAKLIRGLGLLGEAYMRQGQQDWAEDILRLGIQFGQDQSSASELFGLLAQTRLDGGRHGEAIGLFKRALALGARRAPILPQLAECFLARGRYVAALACLDEADQLGQSGEADQLGQSGEADQLGEAGQLAADVRSNLDALRARIEAGLGEALDKFRSA